MSHRARLYTYCSAMLTESARRYSSIQNNLQLLKNLPYHLETLFSRNCLHFQRSQRQRHRQRQRQRQRQCRYH